jgi:hypothetical protein
MRSSRLVLIIAAATALSGCQSFLGISLRGHTRALPGAPSEPALAQATAQGRAYLASGQTGLAIEAFQRALGANEPAAPALNGMGVAFARLGRYDVAERMFQEAMAVDPSDGRYARNLATLMSSPALAMRHDGDIANRVATIDPAPARPAQASAAAQPRDGQLVRVSSAEYRIVTVAQPANEGRAAVAMADRFRPLVRVQIGSRSVPQTGSRVAAVDPRFKPVVRVELSDSQQNGGSGAVTVNPYVAQQRSTAPAMPRIVRVPAKAAATPAQPGSDL